MNIQYKIRNTLGLLLVALLGVSCQDWLDVSPRTEVKYDDLFSHKNGFKDQLTGIYTAMCSEGLYGAHLTFGMMDALGQQYVWKQEIGCCYNLHRFEYGNATSQSVINGVWSDMYNAIANVNILLKGIDEHRGVMLEEEEKIYEGEAYALRAFLHFDLLRLFGKSYAAGAEEKSIPYVVSISKEVTPLSTVSEVCDKVIADLQRARQLLADDPIRTGESADAFLGTRSFRFNYYAVTALLARAYLYKNDKVNAKKCAIEVMESEKYPWVSGDNVTTPTRRERDGIFKSECIFMLNDRTLVEEVDKYLISGGNTGGELLRMSAERRDAIFETVLYGFDWRYNYYFEALEADPAYCGSTKLHQPKLADQYNNRLPLLRISEMWLIAAECASSKGEALDYLNTLRRHRGFDETNDLKETEVTDEMLPDRIGKEYRKEFIGEGQWFFYCKRLNLDLPDTEVAFSKDYYVLPMPDREVDYGDRN